MRDEHLIIQWMIVTWAKESGVLTNYSWLAASWLSN
jgi:hypothetical protein